MAAPSRQNFMSELLLQNYHTQSYFMTSLPILTSVMKGQNDYLNFSQKQTEADRGSESLFGPKPRASKLGFKSRGWWPPNPGRDGALKSICPLYILEVLVTKLERTGYMSKDKWSSRPACPIELSVMIDRNGLWSVLSNMAAMSHTQLLGIWHVASAVENLNF